MNARRVGCCVLLCLFLSVCALAQASDESDAAAPREVVDQLHGALLASMNAPQDTTFADRCKLLEPTVRQTYDLDFIGRSALRSQWKDLSDEQRAAYLDVFAQLSIGTYADRFDRPSGITFEFTEQQPLKRGVMVRTLLTRPKKAPVHLDYMLVEIDGQWKIINVVADGVSDIALKRAEYATIFDNEGFDGLMTKLRAKVDALPAEDQ